MSNLIFYYFIDYEDGKMARVTTTGEHEIPVNIFIDNASEIADVSEGPCSIDICAVGRVVSIFASEEEYYSADTKFALKSMIPIGTFSADPDDESFVESPHILFTGKAIDVMHNPNAGPDEPNYCILIETMGLSFRLYTRYDEPVEKGFIVHGAAWLFGNLKMDTDAHGENFKELRKKYFFTQIYKVRFFMEITGYEEFTFHGVSQKTNLIDFWRFRYSNIYDMQGALAEFIVAKALGIASAQNIEYWTLWDITYQDLRIEVKETSYYHPWNKDGKVSESRSFGITKANSRFAENATGTVEASYKNTFERQNDLYVFCLNTGNTPETSYPLNLDHWEFYVIPTSVINEKCGDGKTISLNKVRKLASALRYDQIKEEVDRIICKIREQEKQNNYE